MMGNTDGFTLVKGISSYGMNKMRKRANIDESKISNFSDMTKTATSQFGVTPDGNRNKKKESRNRKNKMNHTVEPQINSRHRIREDDMDLDGQEEGDGGVLPAANNNPASTFHT